MSRRRRGRTHAKQSTVSSVSFHKKLLDSLHDGVYFVDRSRRITYWNHGAERLTGYASTEAVNRPCFDNFLGHVDDEGVALCLERCPLEATIDDGQPREAEVYLRHKLGHRIPVCIRTAPIHGPSGEITGAVEIFGDVTEKKRIERRVLELENLAFRDPLTALANRRYTELKLAQAVQEHEEFGRTFGLLMIDVDHFKHVNDIYGHVAGDTVLKAISDTLTLSLRAKDLVGRWGGEEFLVILADVTRSTLLPLAERSRTLIAASNIAFSRARIQVTVSVGATLFKCGDSAATLIQRADAAAYLSKAAGRNCTRIQ